ncbi:MAG: helix-turn-helix domain-containing protein [Actinomycetota bacterium]|nr:helix-turn-helix domain-containing protein [Actinomycetota bacterium]
MSAAREESDLARLLRARRRELGLSRNDVVDASGLSYPYVSQLETGYRTPSRKSVARLAQALRMDADDLAAAIPYEAAAVPAPAGHPPAAAVAWQPNPAYEGRSHKRPTGTDETARLVATAVDALGRLPVSARLAALADVQRQVVEQVVRDRGNPGA